MVNKESIFESAKTLSKHPIEVPEWGGTVYIRELSGWERDCFDEAWFKYKVQQNGSGECGVNFYSFLIAWLVVDESGKRFVSDSEIMQLAQVPAKIILRVAEQCMKINGMGRWADVELPKSLEQDPNA